MFEFNTNRKETIRHRFEYYNYFKDTAHITYNRSNLKVIMELMNIK